MVAVTVAGRFDLWGHGHQWFHACVVLTQQMQLRAVRIDLLHLERGHHVRTELLTLLLPFLALALLEALTMWFCWNAVCDVTKGSYDDKCGVNKNKPKQK
jgi:hypothetical protein